MKDNYGVEIEEIRGGSIAERAGLLSKDRLVAVNGHKIRDAIDLMFYSNEPDLRFLISRNGKKITVSVTADEDASGELGIVLKPFRARTCRNNCIFCFVSQLPKGMRKPLYLKDDDYRMSFLFGNYITMTNLSAADKDRIITQRLSPLYISVHSTDTSLRNKMIGNAAAADIMKELKFLADHRIRMHVQIVLCPG
ncbi:MAG: DUF512 domain-containing protein, partial [Nitrospirae bacterium]|nr:DUF512 domain-containing protein [Nitrospirota bacterium]